ncbi:sulfite exporter TauE/SafE family protein [Halobacterium salinarum]|uniref:sulfite exporter TauE/SafE family protein n=1 Tax=Halobacterium salinarum TaxID=2242 RepID=UPI0010A32178|nr:sulfite exporter TauE/SafE family protein [Halobacterium salinarum]QRY23823.1 sulfite exporter TauE/SafE family protein [Halobacterium sp. GSL-19]MCF2166383.1 sulfite exporter TauE/SafE family protein [Halobacterium salinarum]MCF2167282.1 sulfite exporter TauE/SafE family protein [Halobacterium salinarum]MCF2208477.1 sulfite exporter TauE/SafE family protein [Halobacterium salinarum]MCF2238899.1 sulfite exporter TauE/SafE family protein [Halobacterium salinarum]
MGWSAGSIAETGAAATPDAGVVVFFVVGLLGGAHCLGMCGPLVTMYADRIGTDDQRGPSTRALRQHALFNGGRTVSYAAVGGLMGAVGGVLVDAGGVLAVAHLVRGVAGVVAGAAIVAAGVGYAAGGGSRLAAGAVPGLGRAFSAVTGRLTDHVDDWATGPRIAVLGAAHGALPCPLIYPGYVYAVATASPVEGAAALGALGLGTFPTLFAYGTAVDAVSATTRRRVHRALGVAFVVAGTIPLAKGLAALGWPVPQVPLPMPPLPT